MDQSPERSSVAGPSSSGRRSRVSHEEDLLDIQSSLSGDLFSTAMSVRAPTAAREARDLLQKFLSREQGRTAVAAREEEKCFRDLQAQIRTMTEVHLLLKNPENFYLFKEDLETLLCGARWLLSLPDMGGEFDLKLAVLDMLIELKAASNKEMYEQLFSIGIYSSLYLSLLNAVTAGELLIDEERTMKLLKMWVYRNGVDRFKQINAAFISILTTLPLGEQKEVLEEWMPVLMRPRADNQWEPWFKTWLEKVFLGSETTVSASVF
jgi:hypothetical protein